MAKGRAADCHISPSFQQPGDTPHSKLTEAAKHQLTLNQPVTGSSPVRLTSKLNEATPQQGWLFFLAKSPFFDKERAKVLP